MKSRVTLVETMLVMTIAGILSALVFGRGGGCLVGCNPDYSEGERVGIVTKLSRKGWQNKTWEGEMNLGGMKTGSDGKLETNVWKFTIPDEDEDSIKLIQEAQRSQKPIIIRYKEWQLHPVRQTDSGFMVQGVEYVKPEKTPGK
jgi:hypothetical protein